MPGVPRPVRAYDGWGAAEGAVPDVPDPARIHGGNVFADPPAAGWSDRLVLTGRQPPSSAHPALATALADAASLAMPLDGDGGPQSAPFGRSGRRAWPPAHPRSANPNAPSGAGAERAARGGGGLSTATRQRLAKRRVAAVAAVAGASPDRAAEGFAGSFSRGQVPAVHQLAAMATGGSAVTDASLRALLQRGGGAFPDDQRLLAWRFLLRLPGNARAFHDLRSAGQHPAFDDLGDRFPMRSRRLLSALQDTVSVLAHWCPALADAPWLPNFVFPFVKLTTSGSPAPALVRCELCIAMVLNFAATFLQAFPMAPVQTLGAAEAALRTCDPRLADHLAMLGVTPERWAWPLLRSAFSEALPRSRWVRLWDGLVARAATPARAVAAAVAYLRLHRSRLLAVRAPARPSLNGRGAAAAAVLAPPSHAGPPVSPGTAEVCALLRQHLPTDMGALERLIQETWQRVPADVWAVASPGNASRLWPGIAGGSDPDGAADCQGAPGGAGGSAAGSGAGDEGGPAVWMPQADVYPSLGRFPAFSVDFQLKERERIRRAFEAEERRFAAAEAADAEAMAAAARGRAAADAAAVAVAVEERRSREAAAERAQADAEERAREQGAQHRRTAALAALEAGESAALEAARARRSIAAARRHEAAADADRRARARAASMARAERSRIAEEEARARARILALRRGLEATAAAEEEAAAAEARSAAAEEAAVVAEWQAEEEERAVRRRAREAAEAALLAVQTQGTRARVAARDAETSALERESALAEAAAARRARMAVEDEADWAAGRLRATAQREGTATATQQAVLRGRRQEAAARSRAEAVARRDAHAQMRAAADAVAEAEAEAHRLAQAAADRRGFAEDAERIGRRGAGAMDTEAAGLAASEHRLGVAYAQARGVLDAAREGPGASGVAWVADHSDSLDGYAGVDGEEDGGEFEDASADGAAVGNGRSGRPEGDGSAEGGRAAAWRLATGRMGVDNPMSGFGREQAERRARRSARDAAAAAGAAAAAAVMGHAFSESSATEDRASAYGPPAAHGGLDAVVGRGRLLGHSDSASASASSAGMGPAPPRPGTASGRRNYSSRAAAQSLAPMAAGRWSSPESSPAVSIEAEARRPDGGRGSLERDPLGRGGGGSESWRSGPGSADLWSDSMDEGQPLAGYARRSRAPGAAATASSEEGPSRGPSSEGFGSGGSSSQGDRRGAARSSAGARPPADQLSPSPSELEDGGAHPVVVEAPLLAEPRRPRDTHSHDHAAPASVASGSSSSGSSAMHRLVAGRVSAAAGMRYGSSTGSSSPGRRGTGRVAGFGSDSGSQ